MNLTVKFVFGTLFMLYMAWALGLLKLPKRWRNPRELDPTCNEDNVPRAAISYNGDEADQVLTINQCGKVTQYRRLRPMYWVLLPYSHILKGKKNQILENYPSECIMRGGTIIKEYKLCDEKEA